MNKWLILFGMLVLFGSCKKSDSCTYSDQNVVATTSEVLYLSQYLSSNSIVASQHSSGFFYVIDSVGTGANPNVCSNTTVTYTGSLLPGGQVFETVNTSAGVSFALGQTIVGWQKGLSLIKAGGRITLYIPPSLAYGPNPRYNNAGAVVIPANSYLKFTVKLIDVQ